MLSVFVVLVVFFGLTVFLLDMLFRRAAESSLREVLDAQMVALVAAADPDGPESVTPTALLDTRFETPGSGLYAEIRSGSGESIWRSQSAIGTDVQFGPPLEGGERQFIYTEIAGTPIRLAVASRGIVWDDLHGKPARFTFSVASSLKAYDAAGGGIPAAADRLVHRARAAVRRDAGVAAALAAASRCAGSSVRSRKSKRARAKNSATNGRSSSRR